MNAAKKHAPAPCYTPRELELARYLGRNQTARDVLVLLRVRRKLTAKELADFLRVPWSTIRGHLIRLRSFDVIREAGTDRGSTLWKRR